jgi:hypothetical protein
VVALIPPPTLGRNVFSGHEMRLSIERGISLASTGVFTSQRFFSAEQQSERQE